MIIKRLIFIWIAVCFGCTDNELRFTRISSDHSGIDFINTIIETDSFNVLNNEYLYNGGGIGIGDLNNDGYQDIIFAGNHVASKVYLNAGEFKFTDITSNFENLTSDQWFSGVTIVDINNDGWLDVYLTSTTYEDPELRKNRLWVNQGAPSGSIPEFKELAEEYGIADTGYSVHAAFFDYDLDGDLDLYILNNTINKTVQAKYRLKIVDGSADNNDKLYNNDGKGHFTDVSIASGIVYEGFGLGLAIGDVNQNGYPDIYVSNDYISNDLFYINQGDGTFINKSEQYLSYQSKSSMGNDMADVNNDGLPDIYTLDMFPEDYSRKKQTINGNSYLYYINDKKFGYEYQYVRNMLHINNGLLVNELIPFSEVGQLAGIYQTEWSWSALFADYDNDGDKDLLITNGFPKDVTDKDWTNYKAQVYGYIASDKQVINRMPILKVRNFAFENMGDLRFNNVSESWGFHDPSFSNGASFADLDNDGDLDYVVSNLNEDAFIFRNNSESITKNSSHFIRIKLIGNNKNRMAIGAKVHLWSEGTYQFQENFLSRGYISSVDPILHFGLSNHKSIDSIKVIWPDGKGYSIVENIQADQKITIDENSYLIYSTNGQDKRMAKSNHLFVKLDSVITYNHEQEDYIDFFQNQNIIQHKFSQIGPVMATGDLNGDGLSDIVIGATNKAPTAILVNRGSKFEQTTFPGLTKLKNCPESALAIFDIDFDGDNDIIALSGGYQNKPEEYIHHVYTNDEGNFMETELDLPPFPGSVVEPFDFDHDGDLDIFVGARVDKGRFPFAPYSYIMINNNGHFEAFKELIFDLGMTTDAVWSDYDNDGWEDLLVTREWNSIAILKNESGKSFAIQNMADIDDLHGLWYTISSGDFDKDGDDDYIVGNLGENHRFTVNKDFPMQLYAIDLESDGTIDPITTAFWKNEKGIMTEYPVNYLDEMAQQSPFIRKKIKSYAEFSMVSINDILDVKSVPEENKYYINTTASYLLWNEDGVMTAEKLPRKLQTSPITKILIDDFNGDQYPDIMLLGNDHSYDVSTGLYDANKGYLMLSNGEENSFMVKAPTQSGLFVHGQVGSVIQVQGESNLIAIGINRDSILVFQPVKKKL